MRRVVIVNAEFPPSSLPPALRVRLFATHLPECGWEPIVVTTAPEYYETRRDDENEALVPAALEVIRTPALDSRWTRKVGVGDIGGRSLWSHWRAVTRLAGKRRIDAMLIPVPPFMTMLIGRLLYASHRVPYVVDYSDPWVSDEWRDQPPSQRLPKRALADRVARALEPVALRHAAHVIGVSQATAELVASRYPWLRNVARSEIPFGGEEGDFHYIRAHPRRQHIFDRSDAAFHLTAASACTPPMLPTIRATLDGIRLGRSRQPDLFAALRVHFVGTSYAGAGDVRQVAPIAAECGVADLVAEHPARVSYLDSLQLLLDSDALLIPGLVLPRYTASKVFPYLLAERPLLAILHEDSSAAATLRDVGSSGLIAFRDDRAPAALVEEIAARLEKMLRAGKGQRAVLDRARFAPHTAQRMTERLAEVLDAVARN